MTTFYVVRAKKHNKRWPNWGTNYLNRFHGEWREGEYLTQKQGFQAGFQTARFFDSPKAASKNLKTSNEVTSITFNDQLHPNGGWSCDHRRLTDDDINEYFDIIPIEVPEPVAPFTTVLLKSKKK